MINYSEYEKEAINVAVEAIRSRLIAGDVMGSPTDVGNFLKIKLANEPRMVCCFILKQPAATDKLPEALQGHYKRV